jgi:hypothetical protein
MPVNKLSALVLSLATAFFVSPVYAMYTTVNIAPYINGNIPITAGTYPVGTTTGNQGTGIPFAISTLNGLAGAWIAPSGSATLDVAISASGRSTFYALLNNYEGLINVDEYNITFKAENGDSVTFASIGGVDTRDYNDYIYTDTISNSTINWYNNGAGNPRQQRLDVRSFSLPSSFFNDTITDFIITQQLHPGDANFDNALFSGLTIDNIPEPPSGFILGVGLVGFAIILKVRRGTFIVNCADSDPSAGSTRI